MDISVMFLKLNSSSWLSRPWSLGSLWGQIMWYLQVLGWQRTAEPEKLALTTVFQLTL